MPRILSNNDPVINNVTPIVEDERRDDFTDLVDVVTSQPTEDVVQNEQTQNVENQESQTQADQSEVIDKTDAKNKSSTSPQSAPTNVDNSQAVTSDVKIDNAIKSTPTPTGTRVTTNIVQNKINDPTYWAYRKVEGTKGGGVSANEKKLSVSSILGYVKYYFNASWSNLTSGIQIQSIWDVLISMNIPQVGVFNSKIPYVAEENTEQHMMILNDRMVHNKGSGTTIGLYSKNPSWADEPYWCGIFTDFILKRANLSAVGGGTVGVDVYHRNLVKKGLINTPTGGIQPQDSGKLNLKNFWLPNKQEKFNPNGVAAVFVPGYHFKVKGELTVAGKNLLNYLLKQGWEMATVSVGTSTHVETCAFIDSSGNMITIGGNTGGIDPRNGTQMIVRTQSISKFCGKKDFIVLGKIVGNSNRKQRGLNGLYNQTTTMSSYIQRAKNKDKNINNTLSNILEKIT